MDHEMLVKCVVLLIERASKAEKSDDALKLSQAACNAANAMASLVHVMSGEGV